MQHDAWFFIGVFVFIFIVWVATGGPTHPISFAGPYLSQPAPLGSGTYIGFPHAPFGLGSTNVQLPNPDTGSTYSPDTGSNSSGNPGPLGNVSFGPPSSYRGSVTMSHYVSGAGSSNPDNEYVTISLSSSASAPVTLTGWSLESDATGNANVIPAGTEVPLSGTIEALQTIVLKPGDTAIVASGRSPIGASFRENKCIGYYAQFQQFSPQLSSSCPSPLDEMHRYYTDYIRDTACISYVQSLPSCTLEISTPVGLSTSCTNFLQNYLSYNGCVAAHQNDSDFKSHTWRVYLGRSSAMWRPQYEVVKLIDNQGKTVDAFAY
jgi:hypothetical protein